jgi:CBS domain containing-hemolysin-like protein
MQSAYVAPSLLHRIPLTLPLLPQLPALQAGTKAGTDAPLLVFGIISAVLLLGGLIPQYLEIYRFREVIGLSLIFMSVRHLHLSPIRAFLDNRWPDASLNVA